MARRRARRNPRVNPNLVLVGGLAVGGYLFYRWLSSSATGALTSAQSSVADALTNLFPPAATTATNAAIAAQATGGLTVMLGDGSEIPWSAVKGIGAFTDTDNVVKLQFLYNGRVYRTTAAQPDSTGTYYAA